MPMGPSSASKRSPGRGAGELAELAGERLDEVVEALALGPSCFSATADWW
jgi:hypothetical protein